HAGQAHHLPPLGGVRGRGALRRGSVPFVEPGADRGELLGEDRLVHGATGKGVSGSGRPCSKRRTVRSTMSAIMSRNRGSSLTASARTIGSPISRQTAAAS